MTDTLALKHIYTSLTEAKLRDLGAVFKGGRRNPMWTLNPPGGSDIPRITISQSPDAKWHVYAECSLPRLIFGHNSRLVDDEGEIRRGIETMCSAVESRLNIKFDVNSAIISRLHYARDYHLGDAANTAVTALFGKRLHHFPKRCLVDEGGAITLYHNYASVRRNCVICIYSKHAEVLAKNGSEEALAAALGNLRIEYRANTAAGVSSLCKRLNISDATVSGDLLKRGVIDTIFRSLETEMHFPDCIDDKESPLTKLEAVYSESTASRLYAFLERRRTRGDVELRRTKNGRRNFDDNRRKCERAGVWPGRGQT